MHLDDKTLRIILEGFSKDLAVHSYNVCHLSIKAAEYAGLDKQKLKVLAVGSLLHDIGKSCINEAILNKPDKLTEQEFMVVKQHTILGANLIEYFEDSRELLPIVLYHHERWDGKGYMGLAGEEIPELARLVSIADAFDAMTSPRPYQKIKSFSEALHELHACKGLQFSPHLVDLFESSVLNMIKTIDIENFYRKISCLIDVCQ